MRQQIVSQPMPAAIEQPWLSGVLSKVSNRIVKGLMISLLLGTLTTGVIMVVMFSLWLTYQPNSGVLFFNSVNTMMDAQGVIISLSNEKTSDLSQVLAIFSSRDNDMMQLLFSSLRFIHYVIAGLFVGWLVARIPMRLVSMVVLSSMLIVSFMLDLTLLQEQLNVAYLSKLAALYLCSITAYVLIKQAELAQALLQKSQTLIAYASQSGTAKKIANNLLASSHSHCDIREFSQLTPQCLQEYQQLLVVASTYGDGQGPEKSLTFPDALLQSQQSLEHLNYAVLALGDRAYSKFCAFGHEVAGLLDHKGANALQAVQEVNRGDALVITQWWQQICGRLNLHSNALTHEWLDAVLVTNQCLNEQRPQRSAHAISLQVDQLNYQAGDLLEVITPVPLNEIDERLLQLGIAPQTMVRFNDELVQLNLALVECEWTDQVANSPQALVDKLPKLQPRVYSIASAPNYPIVRLLVRQLIKDDGSMGYTSSRLCRALDSDVFKVAIRPHDSFRLPDKNTPIIMIAAGTGIAPFMSFLAQRQQQSAAQSWLIFGEQYSSHDNYFNLELDDYLAQGVLSQLDCAFSRDKHWLDAGCPRYVGDILERQKNTLLHWLNDKRAHVYVCGNKTGMGESVQLKLQQLLTSNYDELRQDNRLHFDLY